MPDNASHSTTAETRLPAATLPAALGGVRFIGPDCAAFLQGYLTCDTVALLATAAAAAGGSAATPAALCNIKGRVIANGWALAGAIALDAAEPDTPAIVVVTEETVTTRLRDSLERYQVFSKTRAELLAPGAIHVTVDAPAAPGALALAAHRSIAIRTTPSAAGYGQFFDALLQDRQLLVNASCSEAFLPQMLGLADWGAIDFDKGCYLGQEVVARAQHRGQVKRRLVGLRANRPGPDSASLSLGTALTDAAGKAAGVVVQMRSTPRDAAAAADVLDALAVVSTSVIEANQTLTHSGSEYSPAIEFTIVP